jgi:release factor glutamine methyltransferase
LITANLPYIPSKTLDGLTKLHFEPRLALDGGEDGTKFIGELLDGAKNLLKPGGLLLLEIESTCSEQVLKLAQISFPDAQSELLNDYANLPRIVKIQK